MRFTAQPAVEALRLRFADSFDDVDLEQPIANQMKYPKKSVGELLKAAKLEVVKFVRYKVGELT